MLQEIIIIILLMDRGKSHIELAILITVVTRFLELCHEERAPLSSSATSQSFASSNRLISPCHDLGYLMALGRSLAFSNHRPNTMLMQQ